MALAISGIPMLTGDEALAFREKAEETLKKRGSIDFSKQRAEMKAILAKAKFQHLHIGTEVMDFIKSWFVEPYNKTGCRYLVVDTYNEDVPVAFVPQRLKPA